MTERKHGFRLDSFFGFRTPLFSHAEWQAWNAGLRASSDHANPEQFAQSYAHDRRILRDRLQSLIARPEILEALQVASPDLVDSLPRWSQEPDSEKGQRSEMALVRYFGRMCHRPTPFGLFAGHGMGRIGNATRLEVAPRGEWWRHSRLDMGYLCDLVVEIQKDPKLRESLEFRPNSSLYRIGNRFRYGRIEMKDGNRHAHLVGVKSDMPLEAVLNRAKYGSDLADLAHSLLADDLPMEEVRRYLDELIDQQILVSELEPAPTGPEPLRGLIRIFERSASTHPVANALAKVALLLDNLDAKGLGNSPSAYRELISVLRGLPATMNRSKLWQVDLFLPAPRVTLGPSFQEEMLGAMELIHRITPKNAQDPFKAFKESFRQRYDQRWVPLAEALDPECGVGYFGAKGNVALATPLLDGIAINAKAPDRSEELGLQPWEVHLLKRLMELRTVRGLTLELTEEDIAPLTDNRPGDPIPHSFSCMVELSGSSPSALDAGKHMTLIHGAWGPSVARMFGRFCHGDPGLLVEVQRHVKEEERLRPHAIFAEIAHLPEGRMGNVLARPVLRAFEIPYLGRSGAPPEQWISLEDLYVGLIGDRVVLWSRQLNREIVPRLSSAAAYQDRGTDLYRFLASLQDQGVLGFLGFSWGSLTREATLPRVVCGKLVLARAQWRWNHGELEVIRKAEGAKGRFLAMQNLREAREQPRHVVLADFDNELPVDLDNVLAVEALWNVIKARESALLLEDFPGGDQLVAIGPEGAFKHQLVLTFLAEPEKPESAPIPPILTEPHVLQTPGSEWLFAKLYMGLHTAETLLSGTLGEWIQSVLISGDADRWFFLRYSDPEPHLRLRFHGDPGRIWGRVLTGLKETIDPFVTSGSVWRLQLDTYEPELVRYGGLANIERAERIFMADSEAVLKILSSFPEEEAIQTRWRLALVSADEFYTSAGLPVAKRLHLAQTQCASFGRQFALTDHSVIRQLGARFRAERELLATLLDPPPTAAGPLAEGSAILRTRTRQIRPLFLEQEQLAATGGLTASLEEMLESFIHMSVNRLLTSAQRAQEMVIYQFLARWYESQIGRARQSSRSLV